MVHKKGALILVRCATGPEEITGFHLKATCIQEIISRITSHPGEDGKRVIPDCAAGACELDPNTTFPFCIGEALSGDSVAQVRDALSILVIDPHGNFQITQLGRVAGEVEVEDRFDPDCAAAIAPPAPSVRWNRV